jgi:hypothetical protein
MRARRDAKVKVNKDQVKESVRAGRGLLAGVRGQQRKEGLVDSGEKQRRVVRSEQAFTGERAASGARHLLASPKS